MRKWSETLLKTSFKRAVFNENPLAFLRFINWVSKLTFGGNP
ncbi:Hypothetical protein HPV225_0118 [Helicobacter pylori v225d]|nr:Hypothetical protein HPV225_0118 [Helicobacter pylori v225d]